MNDCLSRILFPADIGVFLEHYRTRKHFHVARNAPAWHAEALGAERLDEYLQSEHLPAAFIKVVNTGTRIPPGEWSRVRSSPAGEYRAAIPERLFDLYSNGATLILDQADHAVPSLNAICRNLTLELGFRTHANVYITPRGAAGFSKHTDDHEVLVLQIAGNKRWLLYPEGAPVVEIALQAGDSLYLPRGLAHSARTEESDSIHVTVGLRAVYAFQLVEELASLAAKDEGFHQPMPPLLAGDEARQLFESAVLGRLRDLIGQTRPGELAERRFQSLVENQPRGWPGRLSDLRLLPDMTPATVVRRRPGILAVVQGEGKFLTVEFSDKRIVVPHFLDAALGIIMAEEAFAIGDLCGFVSAPGKVKLVAEFVKAGLLRIVGI